MRPPTSCDTFVAVQRGQVIFGKNSDRPRDEVQNIAFYPAAAHSPDTAVQCTHITLPQAPQTLAVVLSQPAWMWGGEMGANEKGVVIGNEAVWTTEEDGPPALLGMDLLRLGLERGGSAREALEQITKLLERHGQGGGCAEDDPSWSYHNSFLICDPTEAWVLETAGKWWVAERVKAGESRNISNDLSIRTNVDLHSDGIHEYAKAHKGWDGEEPFDFKALFGGRAGRIGSDGSDVMCGRGARVKSLLAKHDPIDFSASASILRDCKGGICMHGGFSSTAAQISILSPTKPCLHFFTATCHPCTSAFKPLFFPSDLRAPTDSVTPRRRCWASGKQADTDTLWWAHEKRGGGRGAAEKVQELENKYLREALRLRDGGSVDERDGLYMKAVEEEMQLYS
ncbi:unnamed protein product [Vitrella brassicaformis CCMP3155]|uniref:Secernin-2 n=1 Tax=Vitrella brassicaformis (strain CCMP3155) TaxID=1169540 RepID=A0A0G4FER8_VITBC|nr:unnamed protein product [Vitrella brassicaformis CCMP3155]|eukprot:CEM11491.1 unnamed protein product [Vitrella brassicaformis CCMP3155]